MRTVFGLGETLLDVIFKNNQPIGANPGGSVLNTLVSLSRLNYTTSLISEIGQDKVGSIIKAFLNENNIDTTYLYQHSDGATTLAMAFLDDKNDATYQFYKNLPKERFKINPPQLNDSDIFLFGSTLSINKDTRSNIQSIISEVKKTESIILYDPNCRQDHSNSSSTLGFLKENFNNATLVRCSDEDLHNIFGQADIDKLIEKAQEWCKNIIVTQNSKNVIACFDQQSYEFAIEPIKVINTIGAGDNFNAGVIYSLIKQNITKNGISELSFPQIEMLIQSGIKLSKEVCLSSENYIAKKAML